MKFSFCQFNINLKIITMTICSCKTVPQTLYSKALVIFFLLAFNNHLSFCQISIIGNATIAEDWVTDFIMVQDINNMSVWTTSIYLKKNFEVKFRADNNWTVNWGGATFPAGTLVPEGGNILVDSTANYLVTFDSTALTYDFTILPAHNVGIGTSSPDLSALLELSSADKGFLPTRLTTAQRDNIPAPAQGLMIINTDNGCINVYNGNSWISHCGLDNSLIPDSILSLCNKWTSITPFGGTPRRAAVAFSLNGKAYVGTGHDGFSKNDFWEYDPALNTWTQKNDFSGSPRYGAVAFVVNGKVYIGGGTDISLLHLRLMARHIMVPEIVVPIINSKTFGNLIQMQISGHKRMIFQELPDLELLHLK